MLMRAESSNNRRGRDRQLWWQSGGWLGRCTKRVCRSVCSSKRPPSVCGHCSAFGTFHSISSTHAGLAQWCSRCAQGPCRSYMGWCTRRSLECTLDTCPVPQTKYLPAACDTVATVSLQPFDSPVTSASRSTGVSRGCKDGRSSQLHLPASRWALSLVQDFSASRLCLVVLLLCLLPSQRFMLFWLNFCYFIISGKLDRPLNSIAIEFCNILAYLLD